MKTRILLMTSLFALTIFAAGQVAQAQQVMLVDIPFSFVAGGAALPAGEYAVGRSATNDGVLVLKQQDNPSASAMILTFTAQRPEPKSNATLVFHRYADRYFLSQVWTPGQIRGRQLMRSAAEKEIVKLAKLDAKEITLEARLSPAKR
jgi:hypothetical protein